MKSIGQKIRTLRKNKHLTQEQLAEALSVSSQSVSKWENQISTPDVALLPIIARYFGITMDELFNYRLDVLSYKEKFIRFMADNGVLRFGTFELRSGRISPYYINTANYTSASQITKLGQFYATCMHENNVEANLLVGTTYREIPMTIAASMVLYEKYGIDMDYLIENGVGKQPEIASQIVLLKDTLSSGTSLRANLEELEQMGRRVTHVIVSVDRMEVGTISKLSARHEIERQFDVKIHAIVTLDDIIYALEKGVIGGQVQLDAMKQYREAYGGA